MPRRTYAYVGPPEIRRSAAGADGGTIIDSVEDLLHWLATAEAEQRNDDGPTIATFVVMMRSAGGE